MIKKNKLMSVILPIYNEEDVLVSLYDRLNKALDALPYEYEVICVNDGSSDKSLNLLKEFCVHNSKWKYISFSRNFGHQVAVSAGTYYSKGDVVAILDADLQDPPEQLQKFLKYWVDGYQVVYAVRTIRKEFFLKKICYFLFYRFLTFVSTIPIPLDSGDFCLMDRSVVDVLNSLPERSRFVRGLRSWAGFRQIGVEYERDARLHGNSKYTVYKLFQLASDGIISFSSSPLRFAAVCGLFFCLFAMFLFTFLVFWWVTRISFLGMMPSQVAGWTSIVCLFLFVSGLQMLILGTIGEYLSRVFDEVKQRVPWVISSAHGFTEIHYRNALGWYVK